MTLEILIVEDKAENIAAAKIQLEKFKDNVTADFALTYEDGLKKMQEKIYFSAIFDLELPRTEGGLPEKLGFELAKFADSINLDYAIMTSGIDHHNCRSAFVMFSYIRDGVPLKSVKEYSVPRESILGVIKMTETPKTSPKAWEKVINVLLYSNEEDFAAGPEYFESLNASVEARKRYFEFTGKHNVREK
jgi:hypothetical protein